MVSLEFATIPCNGLVLDHCGLRRSRKSKSIGASNYVLGTQHGRILRYAGVHMASFTC